MMFSVVDLERETKISQHTWRGWIREGRIPAKRIGRRVRVEEADFKKFIAEYSTPAREQAR